MDWIRQDQGITQTEGVWTIPYPPPKPNHLPLAENVLLSKPFSLPKIITLNMDVNKEFLSSNKWQEFAVFLADDVVTWKGREVGFRFPLNKDRDTFSCYLQYSIMRQPYIPDTFITVPVLHRVIEYSIEFEKLYWNLYRVKFTVEALDFPAISYTAHGWFPKNTFSLALVSHNWNTLEAQHLSLKVYSVTMNGINHGEVKTKGAE